jgi:hypothetical protein
VRFDTWRTLTDAGLDAAAIAALVVDWVNAVARSDVRNPREHASRVLEGRQRAARAETATR